MARTRRRQWAASVAILSSVLDRQRMLPISPISIDDLESNGRANRLAVPYAAQRLDAVLFDLLPAAAPIAELAPVQFAVHKVEVDRQSSGQPGKPSQQRLSVRF